MPGWERLEGRWVSPRICMRHNTPEDERRSADSVLDNGGGHGPHLDSLSVERVAAQGTPGAQGGAE